MAGGIDISPSVAGSLAGLGTISVINGSTAPLSSLVPTLGPYRPSKWSRPATTMITVPAGYLSKSSQSQITNTGQTGINNEPVFTMSTQTSEHAYGSSVLVFDAVFRLGHSQPVTITKQPVQTGSNIADHAYLNPARLTMAIGMSDVMASYANGMWGNASTSLIDQVKSIASGNGFSSAHGMSKSVSAFNTLDNLRTQRVPLTVSTRLKTYDNMLIIDVRPDESVRSLHGLFAVVEFEQIFTASLAEETLSARPQTTDSTNLGTVQGQTPNAALVQQFQLPSMLTGASSPEAIQSVYGTVAGAGNVSSNSTSTLASLYPVE